jgi:UDP-2,4-diacetamido-2,4,6-trideoxy-beta-L-altropyranose hydrolase
MGEVLPLITKYSIDLVVIDHYEIDYKYEKKLKEKTGVTILSFDDTYEKHYCDILLNHNISADQKKYTGLVPSGCELRCGPRYTLIRDEFRQTVINRRSIKNKNNLVAFLAMGGSDHQNITMKILKVISNFQNIHINLVTTSSNMNLNKLHRYISKHKNIEIHIDTKKMAVLINKADFAIISPSVISAEVIYMKIPFIALKTADNQKDIHKYLKAKKFFTLDSFNTKKLASYIKKICEPKQYNKIKNRLKSIKLT